MAFHCPSCNGSMVFDVATQTMLCKHCGTTRDPQEYVVRDRGIVTCASCGANLRTPQGGVAKFCPKCGQKTSSALRASASAESAEPAEEQALAHFTCQNCGAELEGTEDSMTGFCPYCGGQSMIREGSSTSNLEQIIPFKVDKQKCVELYKNYTKGVACLPKEFKDPSFIQNFVGIYMPYYQYDVYLNTASVTGTKTVERNSRYDVVNHYAIDANVGATYQRGVSFDASKYLDDQISERVQPFDLEQLEPFTPAYLAGFYADTSTVEPQLYVEDAKEVASDDLVGVISRRMKENEGISVSKADAQVEAQTLDHHAALLPLWFLTWRKEDRVAYAVINGATGKVVSDLPLDLTQFAIRCGIVSAVVFAVLELFFQPTPLITSLISLVAGFVMACCLHATAKNEFENVSHVNDKGWDASAEPTDEAGDQGKKPKRKKKAKGEGASTMMGIVAAVIIIFWSIMGVFGGSSALQGIFRFVLPIMSIPFVIYVTVKTVSWNKAVKGSSSIVSAVVLLVTTLLNTAVVVISPVNDGWYYLGDALCIVGLVIAAVAMMITYNRGTTRPLPKLFDRAEVES